jgi:ribosome-binding factor A
VASKRPEKGPTNRQLSVGEKVRKALTEILARDELRDPLLEKAVISVTEVRMANDLKLATAYITVLGQSDVDPYVEALERHGRFIRGRLTPALKQMKYMPDIRFRKDTSFDNYARIDALLRSPEVVKDLERDDEEDETP